jgi:hypothetical protein
MSQQKPSKTSLLAAFMPSTAFFKAPHVKKPRKSGAYYKERIQAAPPVAEVKKEAGQMAHRHRPPKGWTEKFLKVMGKE